MHLLYSDHHGWLKGWLHKRLGNAADAADMALTCFAPAAQACLARLLQPGGRACLPAHDGPRDVHRPVAPA